MQDCSAEVQVTADWLIIQEVLNLKLKMAAAWELLISLNIQWASDMVWEQFE